MKGGMDFRVLARPNNENPLYSLSASYRKETNKNFKKIYNYCIVKKYGMLPKNPTFRHLH